jgi:hypothetical protein
VTSPSQPDRADPLGTAQALANALNGMSTRLDAAKKASEERDEQLASYGRANRHRIWVTYALFAVDIALTVVVSIFAVQAHSAASAANQVRAASVTSCASGNDTRQTLTQVFDHIFASFGPATGTPAQQAAADARLKAIEAYYKGKLAARNCAAIYGVTPSAATSGTGKGH